MSNLPANRESESTLEAMLGIGAFLAGAAGMATAAIVAIGGLFSAVVLGGTALYFIPVTLVYAILIGIGALTGPFSWGAALGLSFIAALLDLIFN